MFYLHATPFYVAVCMYPIYVYFISLKHGEHCKVPDKYCNEKCCNGWALQRYVTVNGAMEWSIATGQKIAMGQKLQRDK